MNGGRDSSGIRVTGKRLATAVRKKKWDRRFAAAVAALLALLLVPACASAGWTGVAKYAGEFLSLGVGGRALGLGSAYVALSNDVTAGYWNPAGLSLLKYPQFVLMHDEQFGSLVNHDYGAAAFPVGRTSSLGVSLIRVGVDDIPDTRDAALDIDGNPTTDPTQFSRIDPARVKYFNAADWALFFTYARVADGDFSYGASIKLLRRDLGDNSATGFGFDVGFWYAPLPELTLGATLQDVTTTLLAWDTGRNELIAPTIKLGSAYLLDALGGRFTPVVQCDLRFENRRTASTFHVGGVSADLHGGLEYSFKELVALRVGYSDVKQVTFGAGLHLPKLNIDYSFAKFDAIDQPGSSHRISIIFTLESEQYRRVRE
jgi:hypothetical protein